MLYHLFVRTPRTEERPRTGAIVHLYQEAIVTLKTLKTLPEDARAAGETFHSYSPGSDALPWVGWLTEPTDPNAITGYVALNGRVLRPSGETVIETPGNIATRTGVWNAVRDAAFHAANLHPAAEDETDYWPRSAIACLFSLVMKELGRRISGAANELDAARMRLMLRQVEQLFATAAGFDLGVGPRTVHDARDFTGLEAPGPETPPAKVTLA